MTSAPGFRQRHDDVEHDGFGARRNHHLLPVGIDAAHLPAVASHRLTQLRQTRRRPVVRVAVLQRLHTGLHNVRRRLEVRFPDLQVDDLPALGFQRPRPGQHLKRAFSPQTAHTGGNSHTRHLQNQRSQHRPTTRRQDYHIPHGVALTPWHCRIPLLHVGLALPGSHPGEGPGVRAVPPLILSPSNSPPLKVRLRSAPGLVAAPPAGDGAVPLLPAGVFRSGADRGELPGQAA